MLELDDSVLLKEYVEHGSEEAFATLVARHVNKVYSIALRHTSNSHQAEEITQAVFVTLAKKSRQLGKGVILSGWLCRTARLSAMTFVRSEIRRSRREQEAHMQNLLNERESEVWPQIAPLLDAAMAGLSESDHDALALRFFDGKSMKEIGVALGASEDAAKMRVNRAVEKLRVFFTKRGIVCSTAALTAAISANAVQAAPVGLGATISTASSLAGTTTAITAAKLITMTTAQKILAASVLTVALAFGTYKVRLSSGSREQVGAVGQSAPATNVTGFPTNGMITTASGLKYQVLRQGNGTVSPNLTDTVLVHYHGTLLDGTVFDSSMDRGRPLTFPVDSGIAGWTEGIQLMKTGDVFRFEIPPHLGYSAAKSENSRIPPNSTLVFEVELLKIH